MLESARARVFEEPSFDDATYDELTSAPEPTPAAQPLAPPARPTTTPAQVYTQPSSFRARIRIAGSRRRKRPRHPRILSPAISNRLLAAELSGDLSLDETDDSFFEPVD